MEDVRTSVGPIQNFSELSLKIANLKPGTRKRNQTVQENGPGIDRSSDPVATAGFK